GEEAQRVCRGQPVRRDRHRGLARRGELPVPRDDEDRRHQDPRQERRPASQHGPPPFARKREGRRIPWDPPPVLVARRSYMLPCSASKFATRRLLPIRSCWTSAWNSSPDSLSTKSWPAAASTRRVLVPSSIFCQRSPANTQMLPEFLST